MTASNTPDYALARCYIELRERTCGVAPSDATEVLRELVEAHTAHLWLQPGQDSVKARDRADLAWQRARAHLSGVPLPPATFRQGNWSHPAGDGSRIIGWIIPAADVDRMGADAYVLPQEVNDALERLSAAHGVKEGYRG
jgi:hypothetical protein